MLWLGLGPDEAYGEYEDQPIMRGPLGSEEFAVARAADPENGNVLELRARSGLSGTHEPVPPDSLGTVRPLRAATSAKPQTVAPGGFDDAKEVADRFLAGQPVIVNVKSLEHETARRIIDFASGLCYGNGGQLERVTPQVYLLTPSDVEVAMEEKLRIREEDLGDSDQTDDSD